ncbi:efflux transporter outer membrane subunit [Sphingomonas sp. CGMCC 1.13654]|uniref:Efflux transporter outer membrane subunit n=1 Tax=Sphingomonas chungangi TaxID=2683589 RepID=A0A838LC77_9SPHN|nr:efflux transporter outer membrane subunit [Sphingomonas chungangi]MBA2936460.1 efflux transporter outer membrane subunit [Sphingomonas chungangi]MVW55845.1 efflux transporter outer membrane subunit [Sphingomonas chungangi]
MKKTLLLLPLLLAGCSFAPHYQRPSTPPATQWKPVEGWQPAAPADDRPRGDWWTAFDDATLNDLMGRAIARNNTLAQAVATYREARAATKEARASFFPTVSLDGSVTHTATGASRTIVNGSTSSTGSKSSTNYAVTLGASWEPDLFGKVANTVSNAKATEQARLADLANARLALEGELATDYLSLRASDAQIASYTATLAAYQRALQITTNQYNAGIAPHSDVYQAQSQLASAQSDLEGEKRTRTQFEDAIAVLVGENPATFTLPSIGTTWAPTVPDVPVALPSAILQRRPDIASAERQVAAANAEIGVEKAAFFPTVSLSADGGFNNNSLAGLFTSAASLWSVGAQVAETILDFGARSARVRQAREAYNAQVANYRQVTLTAFQDVQDNLVASVVLAKQETLLRQASVAADKSEQSLLNQYRAGTIAYTDVATAQATALTARRALIQAQVDRQNAAVALVQALGGGWQQADLTNGAEAQRAEDLHKAEQP